MRGGATARERSSLIDGLLIDAARDGDLPKLMALLGAGAAAESLAEQNLDALCAALGGRHFECAQALLPASLKAPARNSGWPPLTCAAVAGCPRCIRLVLPHGDPMSKDSSGWSALLWAIRRGNEEAVRLLAPASDLWAQVADPTDPGRLLDALSVDALWNGGRFAELLLAERALAERAAIGEAAEPAARAEPPSRL